MSDKELLELAAKAAGYRLANTKPGYPLYVENGIGIWNPLTDIGDALRLAVKLHINIEISNVDDLVRANRDFEERYTTDPYAAIRRAIVRAAAEIGKEKK